MAEEAVPTEMAVSLQLPTFWASRPASWFAHVEAHFALRRIQSQDTKAKLVIVSLPENVMDDILDVLDDTSPNLYDRLKEALIKRLAPTDHQKVNELFRDVQLGDRTPSQMLRHMKQLVADFKIDEAFMKQLWLQRLPQTVQGILAPFYQSSLAELAEAADRAVEATKPSPSVAATLSSRTPLEDRSTRIEPSSFDMQQLYSEIDSLRQELRARNRSRNSNSPARNRTDSNYRRRRSTSKGSQPGVCWYHRRYGTKARKCTTPCTYTSTESGNA